MTTRGRRHQGRMIRKARRASVTPDLIRTILDRAKETR